MLIFIIIERWVVGRKEIQAGGLEYRVLYRVLYSICCKGDAIVDNRRPLIQTNYGDNTWPFINEKIDVHIQRGPQRCAP